MDKRYQTFQVADYALQARYEQLGGANTDQLKKHLLDAVGSMFFAIDKPPLQKLFAQLRVLGVGGPCKVPVAGSLPYDRAAQVYTALVRYPDFMDNYLGKESTCHPSDNLGPLLAASQFRPTNGKDFLTAMAVAYEIACRLIEEIPVMTEGIDHTLLLSYSMVGSMSRLFGLTLDQAANALAICGCSIAPLAVSRASYTSEWKGMASSMDALDCVNNVLLAREGMTGPIALFEGPKGFKEVFHMNLDYEWSKDKFELLHRCILKSYNAEVHTQSAIYATLNLFKENEIATADILKVNVTTFLTAYHIVGSGEYGDRKVVKTKEQADHSLHYLIAVALLDGQVYPEQLTPERINREDVQTLLQKVEVNTHFPLHKPVMLAGVLDKYTQRYPDKVMAKVEVIMKEGNIFSCETEDYPGFFTRPLSWEQVEDKCGRLIGKRLTAAEMTALFTFIRTLEEQPSMEPLLEYLCK